LKETDVIVKLTNVTMGYNTLTHKTDVFKNFNLEVKKGDFVALVGQIGSGKTSLINLICGFNKPLNGKIYVEGQDITSLNNEKLINLRSRLIGIVPQTQNLIHNLTVSENIQLPLVINKYSKSDLSERVTKILEMMNLVNYSEMLVKYLSVGERQLVAVARSFASDPPLILMDEPTEALDPVMSELVMGFIRGTNLLKGKTLIITTHDKKIMDIAQRIIRI
tara:strand:- start:3176 stop:3838 length:663 start_codon:yes stop_codon:yes gene_type:complete